MKIDWNRKYTTIAVYVFLVIAGGILFFNIIDDLAGVKQHLGVILGLLIPFIYGAVIAYLLNPILKWLEDTVFPKLFGSKVARKNRRRLSVLLSILFGITILVLFGAIVIPQIADSFRTLLAQTSGYARNFETIISHLIAEYGDNQVVSEILQRIYQSAETIIQKSYELISGIVPFVVNITLRITSSFIDIIVGVIISVYILLSKETFAAQIKKMLYAIFPQDFANDVLVLAHDSNSIFCGFISGKILDSFIIGVLCFVGMSILHLPYAMLVSVIVGVTNVIPYFGPFIGAIPSAFLIFLVSPLQALYFAFFVLLLQQLDGNIIGPKILGDSTGLSAFWVIFSVTVFGGLFGFVGMLIGVPTFAVIYSLIQRGIEHRLSKKGMATALDAYASEDLQLIEYAKDSTKKKTRELKFLHRGIKNSDKKSDGNEK